MTKFASRGKLLGNWHDSVGSKHALFLVPGADGRIYSGNHSERESTGGALGWYDPRDGTFGGIRFPNDDCEMMTSAMKGKLIVYASDFSHDPAHPEIHKRDGRLIVFDTTRGEIVRQFSPLADGSAGVVVEAKPGILLGIGLHDKIPTMYTADITIGEVIRRVALPSRALRYIARGPEGNVFTFLGKSLIRIDANAMEIDTVCETEPGRMVFLGGDLYIAGTSQLRRISNLAR